MLSRACFKNQPLMLLYGLYRRVLGPLCRLLGAECRFYPTCSEYAKQAILRFGWWRGSRFALLRVVRCHPLCQGGEDLLPAKEKTYE